jgi:DNA-binding IclR family transcriptional regulator
MGRESIEDSRCSGRPLDFQSHFRSEGALETSPNASVRDIAQTTGIAPSTVFYVLTQVLDLEFVSEDGSHKLSDDQKRTTVQLDLSLQAELERAQRRNWTEFDTGDEFGVL